MAVDSNYIYWANSGTDSVGRAALDGSGADPNFITGAKGVSDVSVDSHYVYWTNSGGLGRAGLDGTGVAMDFVSTLAYGIGVDEKHLYWASFRYSPNRGGVVRSNVNGTGIEKKFVSVRKIYPGDVAVDDAHVWWIEQTGIGRSALSGKNVKPRIIKGDNVGHGETGLADMAVDADGTPPKTTIKSGPPQRTRNRSARFKFASSEPDSSFKCKLDKRRWRHCDQSYEVKELGPGEHKLSVRATDRFGNTDPTPADDQFRAWFALGLHTARHILRRDPAWSGLRPLLREPSGFEGLRMSQKVADANDLPRSKVEDLTDFLTELDAGRPGGQVQVTERKDRLAEVAELLGPIGEAFPRLAAVLPPNLSRAVGTSVDGCLSLEARLDRRVPLDVRIELRQEGVQVIGIPRLDGALDGLHVLLRHRPLSISRGRRSALGRKPGRLGGLGQRGVLVDRDDPSVIGKAARDGESDLGSDTAGPPRGERG